MFFIFMGGAGGVPLYQVPCDWIEFDFAIDDIETADDIKRDFRILVNDTTRFVKFINEIA